MRNHRIDIAERQDNMLRWFIYTLIGIGFGILDWDFLNWLTYDLSRSFIGQPILWFILKNLLNYGIWLVPILPIVFFESQKAINSKKPAYTGMLTWGSAVLSYYAYYWMLLSLGKLPHWAYLNIFGSKYNGFWLDYWRKINYLIFDQILEWFPIAILGGAIVGGLVWHLTNRNKKSSSPPRRLF